VDRRSHAPAIGEAVAKSLTGHPPDVAPDAFGLDRVQRD
jgi:hypothetical protein